jgi:RND family efflux transporter MFP subunit
MLNISLRIALGALVLGTSVGLTGCSLAPSPDAALPPPAVTVSYPLEREVIDYSNFTGRTAAVYTIQMRARVTGYLDKINFKDGESVEEKSVLCEIDPRVYKAAYDQAEANVAQAQAHVSRLQGDFDRANTLLGNGAIGREEYEKYKGDLKEARATLDAVRAAKASAKLNLDFTKVLAPVSGRVSRRNVDPGNLIKADDTILTTIVTQEPMYAYFDLDDQTFLQVGQLIREGQSQSGANAVPQVLLGLVNEEGYPHKGTIDFLDNQVDPNTGTLRVRGVFPNKDRSLTPGLFARIRVPLGNPHKALLVTDRAIDTDQGQKVVYVVVGDDVVEKRAARLGRLHDGLREIEAGVKPGERVIVDGIQRVRGGITVVPRLAEMPVPAKAVGGKE